MATKAIDAPRKTTSGLKTNSRRIRKIFGNIHEISEMPNLIEVQRESYEQFLRSDPKTGYVSGLEKTLRSVFPIVDFAGTAHLDFDHYELEQPKYDTDECRQRGLTYAAPMRVTLRLTTFEIDPETEAKSVIDIKEQDVYMGDMPLMTMNGTFIINGTERVIVSQMHRSPGVLFDHDRGKTHASGKFLFAARVIPYRGSWLDFEFDAKDIVNVRIDRKRKLPVTALLHALGMTSEEILNTFYNRVIYTRGKNGWQIPYFAEAWRGQKPNHDVVDADTGEVMFKANEKITPRRANQAAKDGVKNVIIPTEEIFGRYSAYDLINEKTGEIYIEAGDEVSSGEPRQARQCRREDARAARHRLRQHRPVDPQHAEGRQERGRRQRAGRHLPRHAPRRAADARDRRCACSTACSSTPSATTFRPSAASSSTCASASTSRTRSRRCARKTSSRSSRSW